MLKLSSGKVIIEVLVSTDRMQIHNWLNNYLCILRIYMRNIRSIVWVKFAVGNYHAR